MGGGTKTGPDWKQLLEIAAAADLDSDSVRTQVREALRLGDRKTLESLAATADVRQLPVESLVVLSNALYESGGKDDAMALARRAILVHPDDWWLNQYLGWWCVIAQPPQYDQVILYNTACQAIRPRNPHSLRNIGFAQLGKKAYSAAVATFCRVIELKPDYWQAWTERAVCYEELKQWDNANADWSKAIEVAPRHVRAALRFTAHRV